METTRPPFDRALIVGAGSGLSASLARLLRREGFAVAVASRTPAKLADLVAETGAHAFGCDASKAVDVARLFVQTEAALGGPPDIVVYNASARLWGPFIEVDPDKVADAVAVTAHGGFLVAREAARRMLPTGSGTILFTGASASVKGFAESAPFAMGKFALRGLAQSLARELAPKGVHVAHVVIDGGIRGATRPDSPDRPDALLDPNAIAETYLHLIRQPRSAWTWEIELRPWVERF